MNRRNALRKIALSALLVAPMAFTANNAWAGPPGLTKLGGQKVLTLISRDPPWVRCNNNMQVAAELANVYRVPVQIVPHALAGPGAKAPGGGECSISRSTGSVDSARASTTLT